MTEHFDFTIEERDTTLALYTELKEKIAPSLEEDDEGRIRSHLLHAIEQNQVKRDVFGLNPIVCSLQTALLVYDEIGLRRDAILAILLNPSVEAGSITVDEVGSTYGIAVGRILHGLQRIQELYQKNPVIESENFRNLLLSFAEDMRVILIMIADRVNLMRQIRDTDNEEAKQRVSEEAAYLYAPLAHKLGLYKLKSELEDLSLKYLEHDAYYHIKEKLNATKEARDAYIRQFIGPIEEKLKNAGLKLSDMELVELNEAFAAQSLGVIHELVEEHGVDKAELLAKTNVNGSAIAIGHPVGISGNRIIVALIHEMKRTGKKVGLASLCIGGGQGTAIVIKMV